MRCAWIGRPLSHRVGPGVCTQEDPGKGTVAGIVGWVLAHRRVLIAAYLVLLHGLVYFALTHGVFSAKEAPVCSPVHAAMAHGPGFLPCISYVSTHGCLMTLPPAIVVPISNCLLSKGAIRSAVWSQRINTC